MEQGTREKVNEYNFRTYSHTVEQSAVSEKLEGTPENAIGSSVAGESLDQNFVDHYKQWVQDEVFYLEERRQVFRKFSHQVLKTCTNNAETQKLIDHSEKSETGIPIWRDLIEDSFFKIPVGDGNQATAKNITPFA